MKPKDKWSSLGWRHPLWDLLRYYCSLRSDKKKREWLKLLTQKGQFSVEGSSAFPVSEENATLLKEYLEDREHEFGYCFGRLRTEEKAKAFCDRIGREVGQTSTKNKDHHQSSKALVAGVSAVAEKVADKLGLDIDPDPQKRCVWCGEHGLHVTARNLDGAVPGLVNPRVIWEIKEYWGQTSGGSKMSDAVYECNLVGRELREFEEESGIEVQHFVFVDGKVQWSSRKSDLARFIDLTNQGLIDRLFVGQELETDFEIALEGVLA